MPYCMGSRDNGARSTQSQETAHKSSDLCRFGRRRPRGKMALARAWRPQQVDDPGTVDKVQSGEGQDSIAVQGKLEGEVEPGSRLDHRQSRHAQCGLDPAVFLQRQFLGQQIVDGIDPIDLPLLDAAQRGVERFQRGAIQCVCTRQGGHVGRAGGC